MGYNVVKQPDGLFAVWSPTVDDYVFWDCTEDDLEKIWKDEYGRQGMSALVREMDFANGLYPGHESFTTRLIWREFIHEHHDLTNDDAPYQAWLVKWKTPEVAAEIAKVRAARDA